MSQNFDDILKANEKLVEEAVAAGFDLNTILTLIALFGPIISKILVDLFKKKKQKELEAAKLKTGLVDDMKLLFYEVLVAHKEALVRFLSENELEIMQKVIDKLY